MSMNNVIRLAKSYVQFEDIVEVSYILALGCARTCSRSLSAVIDDG